MHVEHVYVVMDGFCPQPGFWFLLARGAKITDGLVAKSLTWEKHQKLWLDERSTSNGAVCSRVEPARLGGRWFGADRQGRSKPNPPGRWRGDGRPPLQTALPDGDATTLAQGSTMLSQGPTCGHRLRSAPGTASVYKMRLRADPHRSQITCTDEGRCLRKNHSSEKRDWGMGVSFYRTAVVPSDGRPWMGAFLGPPFSNLVPEQ